MDYKKFLIFFIALGLAGCAQKQPIHKQITSINIIDRNGLSETISSKDRLEAYQNTDFLQCQPYQKVLRVYGRAPDGSIRSCITSYHPNGQLRQCLEAINGRACGDYREWHSNGVLKLDVKVIGGIADINTAAEESWLFEGISRAWDEEGRLLVEMTYTKGELEGVATYYYPSGLIWKAIPYLHNQLHGTMTVFFESGAIQQCTDFCKGLKEGSSKRFWKDKKIAADEFFHEGRLQEGVYFSQAGIQIAEVHQERGWRAVFNEEGSYQLQEYHKGIQEGCVKTFDKNQRLLRSYFIKDGVKNGEELVYSEKICIAEDLSHPRPILSVPWLKGSIQGLVKTWYDNGKLESQREISMNKKNGLCTAWYKSGGLMLLEEYHQDSLVSGEYFRKDDSFPISKVVKGKGVATLFDPEGRFLRKVHYRNGRATE